jgi:hypothetical protein
MLHLNFSYDGCFAKYIVTRLYLNVAREGSAANFKRDRALGKIRRSSNEPDKLEKLNF